MKYSEYLREVLRALESSLRSGEACQGVCAANLAARCEMAHLGTPTMDHYARLRDTVNSALGGRTWLDAAAWEYSLYCEPRTLGHALRIGFIMALHAQALVEESQ